MKQKIKWVLLATAVVAIPLFFIHPFGRVKAENSANPLLTGAQTEAPVIEVMQRSCASCHSEQTVWPWYSYVPPMSWMVEKDVRDGREHFNMSHWNEKSAEKRMEILSEISVMVRNKQMPLPRYTLLHPHAKLSEADISLMDRWSHGERRRLRAEAVPQGTD
jgi:Haem-binding domain